MAMQNLCIAVKNHLLNFDPGEKLSNRVYYFDTVVQKLFVVNRETMKDKSIELHLQAFGFKYYTDDVEYCSERVPELVCSKQSNVNLNLIIFRKNHYGSLTDEVLVLYTHENLIGSTFLLHIKKICKDLISISPHTCYPIELRRDAIMEEEKRRLSEEYQKKFTEAEKKINYDWLDEAEKLQNEIAFKFCPDDPIGFLNCVRYCPCDYVPHWKLYNRAGLGYFPLNNLAQNCMLFDMNNSNMTTLDAILTQNNKTVIIASSVS